MLCASSLPKRQLPQHGVIYGSIVKRLKLAQLVPTPGQVGSVGGHIVRQHQQGGPLLLAANQQGIMERAGMASPPPSFAHHDFRQRERPMTVFNQQLGVNLTAQATPPT